MIIFVQVLFKILYPIEIIKIYTINLYISLSGLLSLLSILELENLCII